jgi:hypothetical protein
MNGYELMTELERVVRDVIVVPNDWLPENFRDERTDGVTLADLDRKCDSMLRKPTDHQLEKFEKDRRIELYANMIENGQEITYLPK